jgi:hypothetical protein
MLFGRRLAFLAAAGALVGVALLLTLKSERQPQSSSPPAPEVVRSLPSNPVQPSSDNRAAANAARAFASALAGYERGSMDAEIRRTLVRFGSAKFASELLSSPARIPLGSKPPGAAAARILNVGPTLVEGSAGLEVAVEMVGAGGQRVLVLELGRRGAHWEVVGLRHS